MVPPGNINIVSRTEIDEFCTQMDIHTHHELGMEWWSHPFYHGPMPNEITRDFFSMVMSIISKGNKALKNIDQHSHRRDVAVLLGALTARPWQSHMVEMVAHKMKPARPPWMGELLIDLWTHQEISGRQSLKPWLKIFSQHKYQLKKSLDNMPHRIDSHIPLWHGQEYQSSRYIANSWTLSERTADFFAGRFVDDGKPKRPVFMMRLTRNQILSHATFYTDERGEQEVFFLRDPRKTFKTNTVTTF